MRNFVGEGKKLVVNNYKKGQQKLLQIKRNFGGKNVLGKIYPLLFVTCCSETGGNAS